MASLPGSSVSVVPEDLNTFRATTAPQQESLAALTAAKAAQIAAVLAQGPMSLDPASATAHAVVAAFLSQATPVLTDGITKHLHGSQVVVTIGQHFAATDGANGKAITSQSQISPLSQTLSA